MASEESPVGNSSHSESSDNRYYIEQVKTYLSPLESRWKYVQTVLLWEKPTHSLCYFIAMTAIFGALAGGKFRMVLLLVVMLASSLFLDDVRVKVWHLLQQGGLGAIDKDADSHNTSLSFLRLCERLAGLWSCFEAWYNKLNKLKAGNSCKYYGILFGLLLVAVFAYQYLPLMVLSYLMACSMFFWPVVKHHGMHKRVKNTLAPFFMPFVVQWQHSRTKRQRDTVLKVADREGDSDEEFSKNFAPNAVNHHDALLGEDGSALDSSSADPPPEVKFLDGIISSAVAQGLNSIIMKKEEEIGSIYDTPSETPHHETLESRSPSVDSSAVFLGGLQFPSVSQTTDNFEFQEGEYMEGLQFPDIEQDSDSESEPFRSINESQLDKKPKEVATSQEKGTLSKENACNPGLNITENVTHSLGNSDVSEDYEMLERSDAEGMTLIDESDNVDSATEGLGSVTNYVGKWLGY